MSCRPTQALLDTAAICQNNRGLFRLIQVDLMIGFLNIVCCLYYHRNKLFLCESECSVFGIDLRSASCILIYSVLSILFVSMRCIRTWNTLYSSK